VTVPARAKARRTWPQRLVLTFNIFVIVLSVTMAAGLGLTYKKASELPRVELGGALTPEPQVPTAPQNYLIVGTDNAEGLDPSDPVLIGRPPGFRSDVVMVLRVIPNSEKALLLSLPRDLWVPIAGTRGSERINTAIQGGASRVIETIENDFDIPINHYVEVNFLGFRDLVGAIGGVPMYFSTPVRDKKTGLNITEPGCVTLDPVQALAFARSRAYEYYEGKRWHVDGTGDLGRISRQQDFLRRALHRAFAKGARNPLVLRDLVSAGLSTVKVDGSLTFADLAALADKFRSFNPDTLATYSVPVTDDVIGGAAVLRLQQNEAQPTLDLFRGRDTAVEALDSVLLFVQNGSGIPNDGSRLADELRTAGFNVPVGSEGDASTFDHPRTQLLYDSGKLAQAQLVASYLDPEPELIEAPYVSEGDVVVVTGSDSPHVLATPRPIDPGSGLTSTSSTTTTVVGVVPGPPPPDVTC
jgi:LCP family protein required for cell wall assembly